MNELRIIGKTRKPRKLLARIKHQEALADQWNDEDGHRIDSQHLLISMLLPPAVKAFLAEAEEEVRALYGARYSHGAEALRWGSQPGSIVLGKARVAITRPRVRDRATGRERVLTTYARFQDPELFDQQVFEEGLKHVSQRDYARGLPKISASFGMSKSSVSRSWIRTTQRQVDELLNRDLGAP